MKKVGIVLLAAGNSKRYGEIKLLDTLEGKKMYLHIFENIREFTNCPKVVVTQYEEIYRMSLEYGYTPVKNLEPELGISHSIHLGLRKILELEPDLDGVLFSVCDQPYLKKSTIEHLISIYINSKKALACVIYENNLGNPCIIGKKYYQELFALEGDVGGKKVIKRYPEDVELIAVENQVELHDIDRKSDKWRLSGEDRCSNSSGRNELAH